MNRLTWPHVAVILIIVAGIVTLGALGRDTAALIGIGVMLLAGLGLVASHVAGQQGEIKQAANGNISRLVSLVESMAEQMRDMPPRHDTTTPADVAPGGAVGGGKDV